MVKMKRQAAPSTGVAEVLRFFSSAGGSASTSKNCLAVEVKLNMHLLSDSAIPFLGVCSTEMGPYVHQRHAYECS